MRYIAGIEGSDLTPREAESLAHYGNDVILFSRNIRSRGQLKSLIARLNRLGAKVSIDHEGGRVHRFDADFQGITHSPAAAAVGQGPNRLWKIRQSGRIWATELAELGFDTVYAPVGDIRYSYGNGVIGDRAYGSSTNAVSDAIQAFLDGSQGLLRRCVKHFPGHGRYTVDSHRSQPEIWLSPEYWLSSDALPFRTAVEAGVEQVMCAHVRWHNIDHIPSWQSADFVRWSRDYLGHTVELMTDDLSMGAVRRPGGRPWQVTDAAKEAERAGYDAVLLCSPNATSRFMP